MPGKTTLKDMDMSDMRLTILAFLLATTPLPFSAGCGRGATKPEARIENSEQSAARLETVSMEVSAEELLAARLPANLASAGWIRLFDGHTLYGWDVAGEANWHVANGSIVVDSGQQSLLCTSVPWQNYELILEFKAAEETNSGVFLRTPLLPQDPATDCYEVNIAPNDNPFPTASVVQRKKADQSDSRQSANQWRTLQMHLEGGHLQVTIDDQLVTDYTDENPLPPGRIGLQHNRGPVEFRNIRLRPLGLTSLLDQELSQWKKYPEMSGEFSTTDEGWLHVQGGPGQLETKESYEDFVLLAEYKLPTADSNSGIFFRCIAGQQMMGYECQLSNAVNDGNPLSPADCGTGGIFRRQQARIVAGEVDEWATVVLVADREMIAAWVNGLQVSNWYDDREPDENPRKGLRLEAGTIMIQGHDPGTDALLKQISLTRIVN